MGFIKAEHVDFYFNDQLNCNSSGANDLKLEQIEKVENFVHRLY